MAQGHSNVRQVGDRIEVLLGELRQEAPPQVGAKVEEVIGLLVELYEIKPATVLSAWLVKDLKIKTDWVITRVKPVNSNSMSHLAVFADGNAYWQSPR